MKKIALLLAAVIALSVILCACSSGPKSLSQIFEEINEKFELKDMLVLTTADQLDRYYGISADDVEEFAGCINSTGLDQEEIIMVKAKDEAAAERIKKSLDTRYDAKLKQNISYNPEQAEIIQACSVEQEGLYVSMIVSENAEEMTKIYKSSIPKS